MRVPIPLVLLLCLSVIGGMWWTTTRKMDFMIVPSAEKLAAVRAKAEESNAQPDRMGEPVKPPTLKQTDPHLAPEPVPPPIELGDLDSPPTLEAYSERALDGHAKLAELAALLEKEGQFQRSLLAWERSLDVTKPDATQAAAAIASIRRLRPTLPDWNNDPNTAIHIVLHAGTGPSLAPTLKPVLEEAAKQITLASAGILRVTADLAVGKRSAPKGPIPAALWLSGPSKESTSTDVLSFTVASNEILLDEVYRTAFQLISNHLKRSAQFTPLVDPVQGETSLQALESNITRLSWREFGKSLNASPASPQ